MDKIITAFSFEPAKFRGAFSSAEFNRILGELLRYLTNLGIQWNGTLQPLIDSLPNGNRLITSDERSADIDPVTNGLDGSQVYTDMTASEEEDEGLFYSTTGERPLTIKESLVLIREELLNQIISLKQILDLVDLATGLTETQKQSIGARIFDPLATSTSGSLDGRITSLEAQIKNLEARIEVLENA